MENKIKPTEKNKGLIIVIIIVALLIFGVGACFLYGSFNSNNDVIWQPLVGKLSYTIQETDIPHIAPDGDSNNYWAHNARNASIYEIFRESFPEDHIYFINRNSSGNYVVIFTDLFTFSMFSDLDTLLQGHGVTSITYDSNGTKISTKNLLSSADFDFRECNLNPGLMRNNVSFDLLGLINNKVYFSTPVWDEATFKYTTYFNYVDLTTYSRNKTSINSTLSLDDVTTNRHSIFSNEADGKLVFQIGTRTLDGYREIAEEVRFVVYDVNKNIFLVTDVIENLSNGHFFANLGNNKFGFSVITGTETEPGDEIFYILTLIFD